MLLRPVVISFIVLCFSTPALAWDAEGHRLTAAIALQYLKPEAKSELKNLLGKTDLASASTWMDRERKSLGEPYNQWHYDNRPVCGVENDKARYCPNDNCLSEQLPRQLTILKSKTRHQSERAKALLFIVHMVGDLHQPFHTGDHNDRGGNQLNVIVDLGQRKTTLNLHKYWDSETLDRARKGERQAQYISRLLTNYNDKMAEWTKGDISQWQEESFALAQQFAYATLPGFQCTITRDGDAFILSDDYHEQAARISEVQLFKAGIRLAALLNESL